MCVCVCVCVCGHEISFKKMIDKEIVKYFNAKR